jgi:branched-chain amino acid transport system ATP-binding protein
MLLLDEPTAGLSPKMADQVYRHVAVLPKEFGVTVLLVDQNVRASLAIADEAYVLAMGLNNTQGSAADIAGRLNEITASWMQQGKSDVARI